MKIIGIHFPGNEDSNIVYFLHFLIGIWPISKVKKILYVRKDSSNQVAKGMKMHTSFLLKATNMVTQTDNYIFTGLKGILCYEQI